MRSFLFLLLILMIPVLFSQTPSLPAVYYGKIVCTDTNVDLSGKTLYAKINGEIRGSIRIGSNNVFGGPGYNDLKLVVNGSSSDEGKIIEFYVENVKAQTTEDWNSGEVKYLELRINCSNFVQLSAPTEGGAPTGGAAAPSEGITGGAPAEGEEKPTTNVTQVIKEEKLEKVLEELNISAEKVKNITKEKSFEKELISEVEETEEKEIEQKIGKNVEPMRIKVKVEVYKVILETGEEKVFTKITKEVEKPVIEFVPKDVAENIEDIIFIEGSYEVIEKDPIFKVTPENNRYSYSIEGDVSEKVDKILTLEEKEVKTATEEKPEEIPKNVTEEKKVISGKKGIPLWTIIFVAAMITIGVILILRR